MKETMKESGVWSFAILKHSKETIITFPGMPLSHLRDHGSDINQSCLASYLSQCFYSLNQVMRIWSAVRWTAPLCFEVNWKQWCICLGTQGTVVSCKAIFEPPHGNGDGTDCKNLQRKWNEEVEMEGNDRSAGHKFCFQLYVSHYVCVSTFEGERLRTAREKWEGGGGFC